MNVMSMLLSRRRLVQAGGAATALVYLGGLPGAAQAAGAPSFLSRAPYVPLVDTAFDAVSASGMTATLQLTAVADLARARSEPSFAGRDDAFALTFSGPREILLDAGIHELRHPALGAFSLFIAPVDDSPTEQRYEVVVDRSVRLASAQQDAPEPLSISNDAVAAAPPVPVTVTVPAASATTKAKAKAKPKKRAKLVQSATISRRGGVLTADIRIAAGRGSVSVRAALMRDDVEYARAGRLLRGRHGIRLNLRELRRTPAGAYELRVVVTDQHGKRTQTTRRVTLRQVKTAS
jgi:hypothetical protein